VLGLGWRARSHVIGSGRRTGTPSPVGGSFGGCHSVRRLETNQRDDDKENEKNDHWRGEEVLGEAEQRGRFW